MRASGGTRPIVFGLILAIGITLTLPHFAFGAARSFGGSGRFKAARIQRQQSFLRPFHGFDSSGRFRAPGFHRRDFFSRPFDDFGFVGVGGVSEQPSHYSAVSACAIHRTEGTYHKQSLCSAALGRRRAWSAGLTARILDRRKASGRALTDDSTTKGPIFSNKDEVEPHGIDLSQFLDCLRPYRAPISTSKMSLYA
jgi:hypothetical protein